MTGFPLSAISFTASRTLSKCLVVIPESLMNTRTGDHFGSNLLRSLAPVAVEAADTTARVIMALPAIFAKESTPLAPSSQSSGPSPSDTASPFLERTAPGESTCPLSTSMPHSSSFEL